MAIFDIVVLVVIVASALAGLKAGLIRSVASLLGLIGGVLLAGWDYQRLAPRVQPFTHNELLAQALSFCLLAILGMVLCGLAGWALKTVIHGVGLGWLDRIFGAIFGLLRGALLVVVLVMAIVAFYPSAGWMTGSWLERRLLAGTEFATHLTTQEMKQRVHDGLELIRKHVPALVTDFRTLPASRTRA